MNQDPEEILGIPLPNEVPPPPKFQNLPREVLHSNTVEALLSQNEDLMARLTITLRRNSEMETRFLAMKESHQKMMYQNDSLIDEVGILREKTKHLDRLYVAMKSERDELEARFGEHYSETQKENLRLIGQIQVLEKRLKRFEKYRRSIQARIRDFIDRKEILNSEMQEELKRQREFSLSTENRLAETRERLTKTFSHMENQAREYESDLARLSEQNEEKLKSLTAELATAENEIRVLLQKQKNDHDRLDTLMEKEILLENRALLAERKRDEVIRKQEEDFAELRKTLHEEKQARVAFEMQSRELAKRAQDLQIQHREAETARLHAENELQGLQALQNQTLKALEASKEKESATTALNRELSLSLEKYRKELESIHLDRVERDLENRKQVRWLEARVENQTPPEKPVAIEARVPDRKTIDRIEALFSEIQSGYAKTPRPALKDRLVNDRGELGDIV